MDLCKREPWLALGEGAGGSGLLGQRVQIQRGDKPLIVALYLYRLRALMSLGAGTCDCLEGTRGSGAKDVSGSGPSLRFRV